MTQSARLARNAPEVAASAARRRGAGIALAARLAIAASVPGMAAAGGTTAAAGAAAVAGPATAASGAAAVDCSITVGMVMVLTGTAAPYGRAAAKAVDMAFRDINAAGRVRGCKLVTDTKDSQGQSTAAVDAANQLVQLQRVPVIIGDILSSTTIPILTTVTGPARIIQMSPAASSPKLTALGRDGRSRGLFFRTVTSDALQARVAARFALDRGLRRLAVIYVNNDFGTDLYQEFARAYHALGGVVVSATAYNEKQSSYGSEVTAALSTPGDGLYLISTPFDGTTIARNWISQGGARRLLLNDGMNAAAFITGVGAKYLNDAYGTSSGTNPSAATAYFYDHYEAYAGIDPDSPAADRAYDAGAIVGLALAAATGVDAAAIRTGIFRVTDPKGTVIHAGPDEFRKALAELGAGHPIRYEGVIGPVTFDPSGDISGPFRLWRITDGKVTTLGEVSAAEVDTLRAAPIRAATVTGNAP
jgi:ABC-type branched-subunit amino acid transport system substrate-binding protein